MGSHSPSPAAAGGCQTVSCTPQEGLYLEPLDVAGLTRVVVVCNAIMRVPFALDRPYLLSAVRS